MTVDFGLAGGAAALFIAFADGRGEEFLRSFERMVVGSNAADEWSNWQIEYGAWSLFIGLIEGHSAWHVPRNFSFEQNV